MLNLKLKRKEMIKKNGILMLLLLVGNNVSYTQVYGVKRTQIIDYIFKCKEGISDITNFPFHNPEIFIFESTFKKFRPIFIKTIDALYMTGDGSGRVFKCNAASRDSLYFARIDSTEFEGYNFGAVRIAFNKHIYAFGGYGFWNLNGYLLKFEEGFDWQFIPISKFIPIVTPVYYYEPDSGSLYYLCYTSINSLRDETYVEKKLSLLNLSSKENVELGIPNYENELKEECFANVNMPYFEGTLVIRQSNVLLFNFKKNKVYRLIDENMQIIFKHKFTNIPNKGLIFSVKNKVFFNSRNTGNLDSLTLKMSQFKELPKPLYVPHTSVKFYFIGGILLLVISILILWFVYKRVQRKKNKGIDNTEEPQQVMTKISSAELLSLEKEGYQFTELEHQLIQLFKYSDGSIRDLRVDELNESLGLKRKTLEIQKKIRTETIHRINFKFRKLTGKEEDLIVRHRSKEDKRFTVYKISEEMMREVERLK